MKKTITFILLAFIGTIANAQYSKLLDFAGANGDYTDGSLISDGTFLYGMTNQGGTNDLGVVFKIKPDGTGYEKLLNFAGAANGSYPESSLISDGTFLYGTTYFGGTNGRGVIFKIKPDGTGYAKLLDFAGTANGSNPYGSLIYDGTFLYGMTWFGGTNDLGVVFKIKPDGTGYVKLLDFAGANGSYTDGSLISDGTFLYGMAYQGGTNDLGVVFKIKPDGTGYEKLLDFAGAANGSYPTGSLISDGTFLYGMTPEGGTNDMGVVFKIKPDGTGYVKLLDFAGMANGSYPEGSLISDGTFLYGMTGGGGTNDMGVIFKIKPDGTGYANLLDFAGAANGSYPTGSLISDGTFLYGMTGGGGTNDMGVVFKLEGVLGVAKINKDTETTIFPNPCSIQTTLKTANPLHSATLSVYNSFGQMVKQINNISGQSVVITCDNLASGLYFIRLTEENNPDSYQGVTKKIIITD